ncbi:MAG: class II D-tagatose-bisphosphate aldolase, non-catalytic subunit [Pseudomonadota bacterium]
MSPMHDLIARNRAGEPVGLPCFCTSNAHVLRAVLAFAARNGLPAVIEATCNQVNQDGGYTGMTPADFMGWLKDMAKDAGLPPDQLVVGGDHLGPNPWRGEPVEVAMAKARELVRLYVEAGFTKIHLDASMACGGEPDPSVATIANRAAELCAIAEAHAPDPSKLVYVIGTEVPIPGGETDEPDALDVTSVARFHETLATHRTAWAAQGLTAAWGRIVSVVTQPGVDFGHSSIYPFVPDLAHPLSAAILAEDGLTFEAHSTDYQTDAALSDLVKQHFFFLKVGPELTFRFREAVFALAELAKHSDHAPDTDIRAVIEARMLANPTHWQSYYTGTEAEQKRHRVFSYSDRIRYYWTDPEVAASLNALTTALAQEPVPETLISGAFMGLDFGAIPADPNTLIAQHVQRCIERYFTAAGHLADN